MTALILSAILCQAADLGTTYAALHRPGFTEGNPVLRGPQLYSLKVSVNVGLYLFNRHTPKHTRWIIPTALAGSGCTAAALNLRTLKGAQ